MAQDSPPRPLHERSNSQSNSQSSSRAAAVRLVPSTPPQFLGQSQRDDLYSRTPLPTHPSHILGPGRGRDPASTKLFQTFAKAPASPYSTGSSTHTTLQLSRNAYSATAFSTTKFKPPAKKRLHIHADNKTFSLLQDDSQPDDAGSWKSPILSPASRTSYDSLPSYASNTEARTSSISASYTAEEDSALSTVPGTPPVEVYPKTFAEPQLSPWNYELVGGLRKVPKTPDLKQKATVSSESPLPPLPEVSDGSPTTSHDLTTKPSFQSANTVSTTSENSNYKIYRYTSPPVSEVVFNAPSSSDSNYQIIGESPILEVTQSNSEIENYDLHGVPSDSSSVIHRPQTSASDSESYALNSDRSPTSSLIYRPRTSQSEQNYELHGDPSPSASYINLTNPSKYSQESLIVPPLKPKLRRSNERLGYYKSRSRESLRTGSLTSISTVLSQQEASRVIVGSGSIIHLAIPSQTFKGPSSWAEPSGSYPPRSYMNEHPHQWSSQLSTVHSVSDGGTERNSRSWSDGTGRRSSGFPSTPSRNSRHVLSMSMSSSVAQDDGTARSDSIEAPQPAFARHSQRHLSTSSIRMVEDQDEYGDGLTDLQDLRSRPSRTRLSGLHSIASDNVRSNTMRSTSSSRTNSLLAASIPAWAKLYYGSGERRYLGAPGSSTEGTDSRSSSFRSGSPNTDHFPLSIYSPRRRPRENQPQTGRRLTQGSMEITPAPCPEDEGRMIKDRNPRRFRTWSMSSIWSPHLRLDRRATRHNSVWEPPSVDWSTEGGWFGRRNVQILMFIAGFIFPFSWMIAAFLPLPLNPMSEMQERDNSTSNLDSSNDNVNDYQRQFRPMDEARYESAKWWRRLNRWMSLVGVLIITVVIVLVVVSVKERW